MKPEPTLKSSSPSGAWLGVGLGVLVPWAGVWLLMGLRALPVLLESPHPFLSELKLTGVMLRAVAEWAGLALLGHLALGGLLGWPVLWLFQRKESGAVKGFRSALAIGAGTVLLFHGWLYLQAPAALGSLPAVRRLPFALSYALLFAGGAWLLWRSQPRRRRKMAAVAFAVGLGAAVAWLPHDLVRRWKPAPEALSVEEPRLLLLSFDALRRDTLERVRPDWALPAGVQAVCAAPSTRVAWDTYFGADPGPLVRGLLVPTYSEWKTADRLKLVEFARRRGARSAFLINDSLSPAYGLGPHPFHEVIEPGGGWKYWLTLGYGTCWPVYSFLQNFGNPIETTNPWADSRALWRDVDRALERNHWVSVHACDLHAPVRMNLAEFRASHGWYWLLRTPNRYRAYENGLQVVADQGARLGPDSSAFQHYETRSRRLINEIAPWMDRWSVRYPSLSGALTSDHGEQFPAIRDAKGELKSTYTGIHGFNPPSPEDLAVPLKPFGATTTDLSPGETFSWLDLRDASLAWLVTGGPLRLKGSPEGWRIDFIAVRADHVDEYPLGKSLGARAEGVRPDDLPGRYLLHANGLWLAGDETPKTLEPLPVFSAISRGDNWDFFFPMEGKMWEHRIYSKDRLVSSKSLEANDLERQLAAFPAHRPGPLRPPAANPVSPTPGNRP